MIGKLTGKGEGVVNAGSTALVNELSR
jgi:hypothetical protein